MVEMRIEFQGHAQTQSQFKRSAGMRRRVTSSHLSGTCDWPNLSERKIPRLSLPHSTAASSSDANDEMTPGPS